MLHIEDLPWSAPEAAFACFARDAHVAFLDSAALRDPRSRYSYLCLEPFAVLKAEGGSVRLGGQALAGDPFTALACQLEAFRLPRDSAPVPFIGGAAGYFGYELGQWLERLPMRHPPLAGVPDMVLGLHDVILAFDSWEKRCWLMSSGFPETGARREARALARATAIRARLAAGPCPPAPVPGSVPHLRWTPDLFRPDYEARVARVLEFIRAGDVFQANFTMAHRAPRVPGLDPVALYLDLRRRSPAPFAAYLACGDVVLASASPERFLKLDAAGTVETRPIKGTRPRHAEPGADRAAAAALAASEKDRAENLMIVDLLRNDLGRVAEIGSVRVPELQAVESFASVHHLVSAITARLRPGLGPVDLLRAAFPGGSITGAPKIRAMEIIDALEASRRGPYCGSIGWIGFDGAMDSSITIRTLIITAEEVIAQAGGGIVADSDPAAEYEEHLVKLRPLLAVGEGGSHDALAEWCAASRESRPDRPGGSWLHTGRWAVRDDPGGAGAPRRLPCHLARLRAGCAVLGLPCPWDDAEIGAGIGAVLGASGLASAVLRLTLSRGVAARGVLPQGAISPTLLITAGPRPAPPPPARLIIARGTRRNEHSPLSRIKSLNYLDSILARQEAAHRGADDALLLNSLGFLAEATAANVFVLIGRRLVTPPVAAGAMPGIARRLILERADAEERPLHPDALLEAEAIILTNSLGLRAVSDIEGQAVPVLGQLMDALSR